MEQKPHSHFLSLPPKVSKSGQRPSFRHRIWFVAIGVLLTFIAANLITTVMTEGVIFPGVSVAGRDLSFKTRNQAREILSQMKTDRSFQVQVGDKVFTSTGRDLGAQYDLEATLDSAYKVGHNSPIPILGFWDANKNGQQGYAYQVNQKDLKSFVSKVVSVVGTDPINATLQVIDGKVAVVPDKDGYRVDQKFLTDLLQNSIANGKDQNLKLEPKVVKAPLQANDIKTSLSRTEEILNHEVVLNYQGKQFIPSKVDKGHWLVFTPTEKPNGSVTLDISLSREQIQGYLQSVANQVDIAPVNKKVNVRNGVSSVEREGANGTAIVQDPATDAIYNGFLNGNVAYSLNSQPVAFKTETNRSITLDYGRYIEVNLSLQRLWAYQDNQTIFSTPITSGATGAGFPTVTGLFSIYAKERSRYLNGRPYGWDYNVYVDYWMPFYGGYGLHDADWRSSFGGSDYYYGGSHGCVNMPKSSAAFLYGWADIGTPVWVHN
jgi:hypothetical protein